MDAATSAWEDGGQRQQNLREWAEDGRSIAEVRAEGYERGLDFAPPTIYIDAIPVGQDYMDFSEWVMPFETQVEQDKGVDYYALIDYNQGPGLVASYIKSTLHTQGPDALPRTMVVSSFHPLANVAIPLLQRLGSAVLIVKGGR